MQSNTTNMEQEKDINDTFRYAITKLSSNNKKVHIYVQLIEYDVTAFICEYAKTIIEKSKDNHHRHTNIYYFTPNFDRYYRVYDILGPMKDFAQSTIYCKYCSLIIEKDYPLSDIEKRSLHDNITKWETDTYILLDESGLMHPSFISFISSISVCREIISITIYQPDDSLKNELTENGFKCILCTYDEYDPRKILTKYI